MVFTHATRVRVPDGEYFILVSFYFVEKKKTLRAPAGNQTRVSSVAGTYIITILPAPMNSPAFLSIPRLELGTSRVLGERHDQLDHTDEMRGVYGVSGFRSLYLVLAKHARFRLRQYPDGGPRSVPEKRAKQCFQEKKSTLRHGESNPGHLRDRQRCYQLHHDG